MSRVLFVQTNCGTGNGISAYIRELTRRLQGSHDCHVVAFAKPEALPCLAEYYGVPVANIVLMPDGSERAVGWTGLGRLALAIRERRIDVVHAHALRAATLVALARLRRARAPVIYTNHGLRYRQVTGARRLLSFCVEAVLMRLFRATVCLSEQDLAYAREAWLAPKHAVRCIRTRIDGAGPASPGRRGAFEVVAVGPAGMEKGTDRFIDVATAARRRDPQIRFTWIGEAAPPFTECREVEWAGRIEQAEVVARIQRASLFLFCSRIDTYPRAVLEAYGAGVPVFFFSDYDHAAYTAPGLPQFRPPHLEAVVAAITELARSPAEGQRLSAIVGEWFRLNAAGPDRFAAEYSALYAAVRPV